MHSFKFFRTFSLLCHLTDINKCLCNLLTQQHIKQASMLKYELMIVVKKYLEINSILT